MQEFTHVISETSRLHARPAAQLCDLASQFSSTVTLSASSGSANARRLMAVMALAAKPGQHLTVTVEGADEEQAAAALKAFCSEHL